MIQKQTENDEISPESRLHYLCSAVVCLHLKQAICNQLNLYSCAICPSRTIQTKYHVILPIRGLGWSSGQGRRLPLQWSRVRILVLPIFLKPNSDAIKNRDGDNLVKTEDGSTRNRGREDVGVATRDGRTGRRIRNGYEKGFGSSKLVCFKDD